MTQNRRVFRLAILVALILGITSSSTTNSNGSTSTTTNSLHIASTVLFLVVTVLQAVQTIFLASKRVSGKLSLFFLPFYRRLILFKDKTSTTTKAKTP